MAEIRIPRGRTAADPRGSSRGRSLASALRRASARLGVVLIVLRMGASAPAAAGPPADPGRAEASRGPLEIRDGHLLAQGRLTLPATSPRTLARGTWSFETAVLWSNSFSWTQDVPGEEPHDRRFLVDGETVTFAATLRRGLGRHVDAGLRVPLHHRGGGVLDGFIDAWHRLLNLDDAQRPAFVRNAFRVEGRTPSGEPLAWADAAGTGLGSIELDVRWRSLDCGSDGLSAALIGRLSLPTATAPYTDGALGVGGQLVLAAPLGRTTDLYLGAGLTVQDPGPVRGIKYEATRGHGFAAFEWRPWRRLSLVAETNAASRLVTNIASYPGVHWVVNVEGRLDLAPDLRLDLGLTENLIDQQSTPDLGLSFALGWRP